MVARWKTPCVYKTAQRDRHAQPRPRALAAMGNPSGRRGQRQSKGRLALRQDRDGFVFAAPRRRKLVAMGGRRATGVRVREGRLGTYVFRIDRRRNGNVV